MLYVNEEIPHMLWILAILLPTPRALGSYRAMMYTGVKLP